MSKYYVRVKPQLNGVNAVHKENCPFLDGVKLKKSLGEFQSSNEAIMESKKYFLHTEGCSFCTKEQIPQKMNIQHIWNNFSVS